MKKRKVYEFHRKTPEFVVLHAGWQASRGRNPSESFKGQRNPRLALIAAKEELLKYDPLGGTDIFDMIRIMLRRVEFWTDQMYHAVIELGELDWDDMAAVINWMGKIREPSDHINVRPLLAPFVPGIIEEFEARGYYAGMNCHDDFKGDDEVNHGQYIIGSAILCFHRFGGIHQVYDHLAEKWHEKFRPSIDNMTHEQLVRECKKKGIRGANIRWKPETLKIKLRLVNEEKKQAVN